MTSEAPPQYLLIGPMTALAARRHARVVISSSAPRRLRRPCALDLIFITRTFSNPSIPAADMQSQCARSLAAGSERQWSFPADTSNHRNGFLDRVLASRTEMMNCLTGSHFLGLHTGHLLNKGGVNLAPELSPDRARVFVLNATEFVWVDSEDF